MRKGIGLVGMVLLIGLVVSVGLVSVYFARLHTSITKSVDLKVSEAFSAVNSVELAERSLEQTIRHEIGEAVKSVASDLGEGNLEWIRVLLADEIKNRVPRDFSLPGAKLSVTVGKPEVAAGQTVTVTAPYTAEVGTSRGTVKISGTLSVSEDIGPGIFLSAEAGKKFFETVNYEELVENELTGLRTSATVTKSCGSCWYSCYSCPIDTLEVLGKTGWPEIESRVADAAERMESEISGSYPFIFLSPEVSYSFDRYYTVISDSGNNEELSTIECSRCVERNSTTGECIRWTTWTETVCDNWRSITFRFTVDADFTLTLTDGFSPVPAPPGKRKIRVRNDANFTDWNDLGEKTAVSYFDEGPVRADSSGKYYLYGSPDPVPGTFALLIRDPENPEGYILWNNGMDPGEFLGKNTNFCWKDRGAVSCDFIPYSLSEVTAPEEPLVTRIKFGTRVVVE